MTSRCWPVPAAVRQSGLRCSPPSASSAQRTSPSREHFLTCSDSLTATHLLAERGVCAEQRNLREHVESATRTATLAKSLMDDLAKARQDAELKAAASNDVSRRCPPSLALLRSLSRRLVLRWSRDHDDDALNESQRGLAPRLVGGLGWPTPLFAL
jgi:hypothetical protein